MSLILPYSAVQGRRVRATASASFPAEVAGTSTLTLTWDVQVPREETWLVWMASIGFNYEDPADMSLIAIYAIVRAIEGAGTTIIADTIDADNDISFPVGVSGVVNVGQFAQLQLNGIRLEGGMRVGAVAVVNNADALARDVLNAGLNLWVQPARMSPGRR